MTLAAPVQILLVDDSLGDISLTREALLGARVANDLHVVTDGEQAVDFVRKSGPYADVPTPDLVLLDLNLPKKNGHEVLKDLKADPQLRQIPVIVLTTSSDQQDITTSYGLHANAFVTKPVEFSGFLIALQRLEGFWLQIVRLPN